MSRPIILLGCGEHGRVLLDVLLDQKFIVLGIADKNVEVNTKIYGIPVLGDDDFILKTYKPDSVDLVNGIGSIGDLSIRSKIYEKFKTLGYGFKTIIHPSAVISSRVILKEGVQVLAGVVINTETEVGENTIINTRSSIDHGCVIGRNVHIAPGCVLSGCVRVGENTHVGTGSTVRQGIQIGSNTLIGVGSVIVKDITSGVVAYGSPTKVLYSNNINNTGWGGGIQDS